jgi:hypothetical protein
VFGDHCRRGDQVVGSCGLFSTEIVRYRIAECHAHPRIPMTDQYPGVVVAEEIR